MNKAKEMLDKWRDERGFRTYKQLAEFLEVAPNTLDVWKQRKEIPEANILKYTQKVRNMFNDIGLTVKQISLPAEIMDLISDYEELNDEEKEEYRLRIKRDAINAKLKKKGFDD